MKRFGGVAGLPGVVQASVGRGLHGRVQVVRRQQDEGIRSAELQDDLLEVAPRDFGHGRTRALRAGHRHPVHARIGDHLGGLLVGQIQVGVRPLGKAGIRVHRGDRCGGLRALRGVLEEDRVSDQQVGRGEPGHLVIREVPGHDAQQHAERRPADDGGALAEDVDRLILHDLLGVVGVELGDVGSEVHLGDRGGQRLAHLAHDDRAQLVAALSVQFGDAADQGRAIGDAGGPRPAFGCGIRRRERLLELCVGRDGVGGQGLARGGIDDCVVTHGFSIR